MSRGPRSANATCVDGGARGMTLSETWVPRGLRHWARPVHGNIQSFTYTPIAHVSDPAPVPRLSARVFFNDVAGELFSLDRGVPYTLGQLLLRPGPTIRRYIVERDPRLTKPFRLVVICLAVLAALGHLTGLDAGMTAGLEGTPQDQDSTGGAFRAAIAAVANNFDLVLVLCWVPAIAAGVQSLYKPYQLNYAEVFVFGLYTLPQMLIWLSPMMLLVAWTGNAPGWMLPTLAMTPVVLSAHGYFRPDGEPLWRAFMCAFFGAFSLVILMLGAVMGMLLLYMAIG